MVSGNYGLIRNAKRPRCRRRSTGDCRVVQVAASGRPGRTSTCRAFPPLILSSTRLCTYGMRKVVIIFGPGVTNRACERPHYPPSNQISLCARQDVDASTVARDSACGNNAAISGPLWLTCCGTLARLNFKWMKVRLQVVDPKW